MTRSTFNVAIEPDIGYGQMFSVLIRQRVWLLGVFGGVLAATAILTLVSRPTYQSEMQLLVEPTYQSKEDTTSERTPERQFADSNIQVDSATQLNLMRSSVLLQRAVNLVESEYPDVDVKKLKESLEINQVVEDDKSRNDKVNTKIFSVSYIDSDPIKAQKVLQALQKVYQDYNLEQQQLRLTKGLAFINDQLPEAQDKLNQAETALEKFRRKQKLVDPEAQAKALTERINSVKQEQQATRTQLQNLGARYTSLQQQLGLSSQSTLAAARLSQSGRYQTLLNEIQKTELALAQERQRFTDDAPSIQRLLDQRQNQRTLLQREVGRVLQTDSARAIPSSGETLLQQGQLGDLDQDLANQLVEAQVNLGALRAQEQSLLKIEQELQARLNDFPNLMAEYNRLQPNVEINRKTWQQLLEARQELGLELARSKFDWQLVEPPELGLRVGPKIKQNFLLGIVAGLMLGVIAAFVRESLDDAVHTPDELRQQVDLPILGRVPEMASIEASEPRLSLPFRKTLALPPSTAQVTDWTPFREAVDLIYKNIQLLNVEPSCKSLVLTSALSGEGKSTLAIGLAISAARLHQRVLLIDADLRRPSLHQQLNLRNRQGLSTLLSSNVSARNMITEYSSPYGDIAVLTAGPMPYDPVKLLSSERMRQVMADFEQSYDLVLVDTPPMLGIVDAMLAASACNGVLMVGRIGQVTRNELSQAIAMLSRLNVLGLIANGAHNLVYYPSYEKASSR